TFPLLSGNPKTALQEPKSVVISKEMALKQFGTAEALGRTVWLKKETTFEPFVVSGVARDAPQNSSIKFDVLMPLTVEQKELANNENWFNFFLNTFVVLNPNANPRLVERKMKTVYEGDAKEAIKNMAEKYGDKTKTAYLLQPFTDMHLSEELSAGNGLKDASKPIFSYILSGIALFILLIACINFVNLTVARSLKRAKEIGIRKVVGSGRKQLIMQFLGESFLLSFGAFLLALLLVELSLPLFNELANKALSFAYLLDAKLVIIYVTLFVLTGLLAGFYPALVLSGYEPVKTLYGRFSLTGSNYLQKSLIVLQFSLASLLIIATMTIYAQFNYLTTKPLGYDDRNMIVLNKSGLTRREASLFTEELMKSPTIVGVAPKNGGSWGTIAKVDGKEISFHYETVNEAYLPLYKIPMVQGRNFSPAFPSDSTHSVLVNESFVKKAGWKNPIGQVVDFWYSPNQKYTVVGVVRDYHHESLSSLIGPQLFTMKPDNQYGQVSIKIRPNTETASIRHIEKVFKRLFPINPYAYQFKDVENQKNYEAEAKWKQMVLFGALLTIFLSCIGLLGVATLSAERRTKEIGIRKILGSSVGEVVQLLTLDFVKLVGISLIFAFPAAWYAMQQWLEKYPYRTEMNVWLFGATALLTMAVALLTVSFQSIKAALTNPVKSLRTE
ncbi:MAG TPA: FtsX-like permease family protein, partial [Fibrella sp.]